MPKKIEVLRMFEVELVVHSSSLLDCYRREYKKKYRAEPLIDPAGRDSMVCKDVVRKWGLEKAMALMEQFFCSRDPWFEKKGHAMNVFGGSLVQLHAELSKRIPQIPENAMIGGRIKI